LTFQNYSGKNISGSSIIIFSQGTRYKPVSDENGLGGELPYISRRTEHHGGRNAGNARYVSPFSKKGKTR
jgi:hypothetical protein